MRDADAVTDGDIEELGTTVPNKLAGFDIKKINGTVSWIGTMVSRVRALFEMMRDRDFRMSRKSQALVAAGLIYFVLPTDFTPDFIPGIGYLDDALVLSIVWKTVEDQLELYRAYLSARQSGKEAPDA